MDCPRDIAHVLLEILAQGTLRIRLFAGVHQSKKCFVEADHLHNLPHLLADYHPERLRYYWDIERPSFIRQVPESERRDLQPQWDHLEDLIEKHGIPPLQTGLRQDQKALAE